MVLFLFEWIFLKIQLAPTAPAGHLFSFISFSIISCNKILFKQDISFLLFSYTCIWKTSLQAARLTFPRATNFLEPVARARLDILPKVHPCMSLFPDLYDHPLQEYSLEMPV